MISRSKLKNFKERFEVVSCFIEHEEEILLLHRQDSKPQGNTWGVPAGKVDKGETLEKAIKREIEEELGLAIDSTSLNYFDKFFVRYPDYDFIYHVFHLPIKERPVINLNFDEHKGSIWKTPRESLKLELIPDEDFCIKTFYSV